MLNRDLAAGVKKRIDEVTVEKQRRNIRAVQQVLQMTGDCALSLQRFLKLNVKADELFVAEPEFLVRH